VRPGSSLAIACSIACLTAVAPARAQNTQAAATIEFDKGRALIKQGKYAEACEAFDNSQKLDPQLGTLFNIAECSEHIGKLATAWLAYRDLGQRDTNAGRKRESSRRAKRLEKRLPRLVVRISDPPPGLVVKINDNDATQLIGIESPVDLGDYTITATAPGFAPFEEKRTVEVEGKTVKVRIELDEEEPVTGADQPNKPKKKRKHHAEDDDQPAGPSSHRKRNGALLGIAGGGLIAVGTVFGLKARTNWNDAQALCPDSACPTAADKQAGDELTAAARSDATKSTVLVLGGAAVTAIGIYLVATARPAHTTTALRITPTAGGVAVVLGGWF